MKKLLQRTTLFALFFFGLYSSVADGKHLLQSIKRLKNKVKKALERGTKASFKDAFTRARVEQEKEGNILGSVAMRVGEVSLTDNSSPDFQTISDKLEQLYWVDQLRFFKTLEQESKRSKVKAFMMLKEKILEKYGHKKTPLVAFAAALDNEQKALEKSEISLSTLLKSRRSLEALKPEYQKKVKNKLNTVRIMQKRLEDFVLRVNQLLMKV